VEDLKIPAPQEARRPWRAKRRGVIKKDDSCLSMRVIYNHAVEEKRSA